MDTCRLAQCVFFLDYWSYNMFSFGVFWCCCWDLLRKSNCSKREMPHFFGVKINTQKNRIGETVRLVDVNEFPSDN